jgi:hypothetical protein
MTDVNVTVDDQKDNDAERIEGYNALVELLEAFPSLESELMCLYTDYIFKDVSSRDYEKKVRGLCSEWVTKCITTIKRGISADVEHKKLLSAYLDVARYQTDRIDASIEWNVDADVLGFLLKKRPPPENPEERRQIEVPYSIRKKREL